MSTIEFMKVEHKEALNLHFTLSRQDHRTSDETNFFFASSKVKKKN